MRLGRHLWSPATDDEGRAEGLVPRFLIRHGFRFEDDEWPAQRTLVAGGKYDPPFGSHELSLAITNDRFVVGGDWFFDAPRDWTPNDCFRTRILNIWVGPFALSWQNTTEMRRPSLPVIPSQVRLEDRATESGR